mgnify:FL=1
MRLKDRAITDTTVIDSLLTKATTCRLGMCADNVPYVVPMNFAHQGNTVFLHCAKKGKRYDMLKQNPKVCFEIDIDGGPIASAVPQNACKSGYAYQSLIANGKVRFIDDDAEKTSALNLICKKYFDATLPMAAEGVRGTLVLAIDMEELTAKQAGNWA